MSQTTIEQLLTDEYDGSDLSVADRIRGGYTHAFVRNELRSKIREVIASVSLDLTERQRGILMSALFHFAQSCRMIADTAAQDRTGLKFKTGASEHFLKEAEETEKLRSLIYNYKNSSVVSNTKTYVWKPIDANAMDGKYRMLRGRSGYTGTPHRIVVAKYDPEFRPKQPWVTYDGNSVLDDGDMPTEYMELIP